MAEVKYERKGPIVSPAISNVATFTDEPIGILPDPYHYHQTPACPPPDVNQLGKHLIGN